ncbi:1,4-dihydroxy-2-naphthoate octaprenyltransferase [Thermocatellispora tengchongensis]|uniref:1,4-dihydroxy-2-naphthoate octaprenyltransferase n=1 Tax=Thermocatellispora tengchongensis TaxID=1073253 RepID=A0A840P7K4_9ACTN|nr:1,4-dihydroxy-2-naphthoate polyprenyltransferase [Thermocatellispora tengchongensis]MBB5133197.1 1,4-dihydroxy-2-naphthoate octaprenyltransferase [Thermocatellispora tengchongensis]
MTATREPGGAPAPTLKHWVAGARPRTLPAALVPVAVGTGAAVSTGGAVWWRALVALAVALLLQIGVNYANDYSDGIRGTDNARVGPLRLVGSGLATPRSVLVAALGCFLAAAVAGLALVVATRAWWLLAVGALSIAAAWFYTGGSRPYGYRALGEVSVFVFFGLVAVAGTTYVQVEGLPWLAVAAAVPVGLLACALLVVNNLRDLRGDAEAGKRTLAVVLGDRRTRLLYAGCVIAPFAVAAALIPVRPLTALTLLAIPLAVPPVRLVLGGALGPALIAGLRQTGRLQLAYGALFTIGLAVTL